MAFRTPGALTSALRRALPIVLAACLAFALAASPALGGDRERLGSARLPSIELRGLRGTDPAGVPSIPGSRPDRASLRLHASFERDFYDTHLLPELTDQMRGFRTLHGVPVSAADIEESLIFSAAGAQARRNTLKGAQNALKEFVMERASINRIIESIYRPKRSFAAAEPGAGLGRSTSARRSDLGFSFGVSHMMPNVGVKYRIGSTLTRFEVATHGAVDMWFERTDAKQVRAAIGLKYDHNEKWYGLHYGVSF